MSTTIVKQEKHDGASDERNGAGQSTKWSVIDTCRVIKIAMFRLLMLLRYDHERDEKKLNQNIIKGRLLTGALVVWRTLQLLSFPFSSTFKFSWNPKATDWWMTLLEATRFDLLVSGPSNDNTMPPLATLVTLLLVVLVLGGLAYVAYALEVKTRGDTSVFVAMSSRPLYLPFLNVCLRAITGPLYIPIMGVLLSNWRCSTEAGGTCWTGVSILLSLSGTLVSVCLCLTALIVATLLIHNNSVSPEASAMSHGRAELVHICVQTVLVMAFSVTNSQTSFTLWMLTLVVIAAASIMLYTQWVTHAFYKKWTTILVMSNFAVFAWAAIVLLITQLSNDDRQAGGTIFFFVGSAFAVLLTRLLVEQNVVRISALKSDGVKSIYEANQKAFITFNNHCSDSNDDQQATDVENDKLSGAKEAMLSIFENAVRKFPHVPLVYVFQAHMYAQYFNNDHVANNCLQECEEAGAPFDAEFFIYKARCIIESKIRTDPDSVSVLQYISATEHMNQATQLMQNAAYLKFQFWTELSEEYPNVDRLNQLGGNVNEAVSRAHKHFQEVMTVNRESPYVMREYGKFLKVFLNDETSGQAMIERAEEREAKNMRGQLKKFDSANLGDSKSLFDPHTAIITISGDRQSLGQIVNVNEAAVNMFGRAQSEMIDNNINCIMPPPFSDMHDGFLKHHQKTGESHVMNSTRKLYAVHKSGFIFPVYLHVKQISGGLSKPLYIGIIRHVATAENEHVALVSDNQRIIRCSAGWSRFFSMSAHDVGVGECSIVDLFSDWETVKEHENHSSDSDDNECYRNDGGRTIDYQSQTGSHSLSVAVRHLKFRTFSIDVVRVVEKARKLDQFSHNSSGAGDMLHGNHIVDESDETDDDDDRGDNEDISDDNVDQADTHEDEQEEDHEYDKRSGGLLPPEVQPIFHNRSGRQNKKKQRRVRYRDEDGESQIARSRKSGKSATSSTGTRNDWRSGLQRIRQLFLNQSSTLEPAMQRLRRTLMTVILGIIFMAVLVTMMVVSSMVAYEDNVGILNKASSRRSLIVTAAQSVRSLDLMRQSVLSGARESVMRSRLDSVAEKLWNTQTELFFASDRSGKHKELYEQPTMTVNILTGGTQSTRQVNFIEALNEFQSSARIIVTEPLSSIDTSNNHVYFVRANMESLLAKANVSCDFYESTTIEAANEITLVQTVLLVSTVSLTLVLVLALIGPAISRVENTRKEIFGMFIGDIPLPMLKKIRDESFEQLSAEDKALEGQSELEKRESEKLVEEKVLQEQIEQRELLKKFQGLNTSSGSPRGVVGKAHFAVAEQQNDRQIKVERTHRRKDAFRFSNSQKYRLFCHITIMVVIAIVYNIGTYFWEQSILDKSVERVPEINDSGRMRYVSRFLSYTTREAVVHPTTSSDFYQKTQNEWLELSQAQNDYLSQLLHGISYGNTEMNLPGAVQRRGTHVRILFSNTCPLMDTDDQQTCPAFHGGILTHGGAATVTEYRALLKETASKAAALGSFATSSQIQAILTTQHWQDVIQLEETYLESILEKLAGAFGNDELKLVDTFLKYRKLVMSLFVVTLVALYAVLYAPLVRKLDVSLKRTRGMLLMIPAEYMMAIPALANILTDVSGGNIKKTK